MYAIVIGVIAFIVCLTVDYRALTDKSHFIYLGSARAAHLRPVLRHVGRRRPPLDFAGSLQPAAVGVRQGRRRARAREVLRREPARRADDRRPVASPAALAARSARPDRARARSRHGGHAAAHLSRHCVHGRDAHAHLGILALVAIVTAPIAWNFALKDYQKSRIETFLDPSQDPKGAGYQQIQAQITVGSGGLRGKGSRRARRDSSGSCRSPTTTSFFRCWRKNRDLSACCSCSACI